VYLDLVEHQRSGDPGNFVFRYRGADGTSAIGRFPKNPQFCAERAVSHSRSNPLTKREMLFVSNGSVSPSVLKSMLATRLPGILRPLEPAEARICM
jgi:hypothetical protein